ncbi:hypothetical protein NDS46_08130 [Paenibacillus thiaminolyticus]|nr:S-layer homology domain-containing protein [Paenibacillus thiaminolyticus]WCF09807.1 hypothetical protein NDS46_08130 [Paenibacillus thiaminolyticus]
MRGAGKAVTSGIVQRMRSSTFEPKGTATRAQAAVMLKRMLQHTNIRDSRANPY